MISTPQPILSDSVVVYEDQQLLAINKPAGIVVNEAKTNSGETVQSWFFQRLLNELGLISCTNTERQSEKNQSPTSGSKENQLLTEYFLENSTWKELVPSQFDDYYGTPSEIFMKRQGIVHRLDKDTSGVLLLAKNPGSLVNLLSQFRQRTVKKKYRCLVHGQMKVKSAAVRVPIARSHHNRHKFAADIEGRQATTYYRVLRYFLQINEDQLRETLLKGQGSSKIETLAGSYQQGFSLLECILETGRTHQIRVHLAHLGHPVVGDKLYGGSRRSSLDSVWCSRQFLHAAILGLTHPQSKKKQVVEAKLPHDLQKVLQFMK